MLRRKGDVVVVRVLAGIGIFGCWIENRYVEARRHLIMRGAAESPRI